MQFDQNESRVCYPKKEIGEGGQEVNDLDLRKNFMEILQEAEKSYNGSETFDLRYRMKAIW